MVGGGARGICPKGPKRKQKKEQYKRQKLKSPKDIPSWRLWEPWVGGHLRNDNKKAHAKYGAPWKRKQHFRKRFTFLHFLSILSFGGLSALRVHMDLVQGGMSRWSIFLGGCRRTQYHFTFAVIQLPKPWMRGVSNVRTTKIARVRGLWSKVTWATLAFSRSTASWGLGWVRAVAPLSRTTEFGLGWKTRSKILEVPMVCGGVTLEPKGTEATKEIIASCQTWTRKRNDKYYQNCT